LHNVGNHTVLVTIDFLLGDRKNTHNNLFYVSQKKESNSLQVWNFWLYSHHIYSTQLTE